MTYSIQKALKVFKRKMKKNMIALEAGGLLGVRGSCGYVFIFLIIYKYNI